MNFTNDDMSNTWAGIETYSLLQSSWPSRGKQNT